MVVLLRITEAKPVFGRVIVADYLPAGLEIDNPRLVSSGDTTQLDWIEDAEESRSIPSSATTASLRPSIREASDNAVFTVAYIVRAVSPGRCVLPRLRRGHVQPLALWPHRHGHQSRSRPQDERGRGHHKGAPARLVSEPWLAFADRLAARAHGGWMGRVMWRPSGHCRSMAPEGFHRDHRPQ